MFRHSLLTGLTIGVVIVLAKLLAVNIDMTETTWYSVLGYALIGGGLFFSIQRYRDREMNGFITMGEGIKLSLLISFFMSILISVFVYLYLEYVDISSLESSIELAKQEVLDNVEATDEEIEMSMKIISFFTSPGVIGFLNFIFHYILTLLLGIVVSAVLKNPEPMFDE